MLQPCIHILDTALQYWSDTDANLFFTYFVMTFPKNLREKIDRWIEDRQILKREYRVIYEITLNVAQQKQKGTNKQNPTEGEIYFCPQKIVVVFFHS